MFDTIISVQDLKENLNTPNWVIIDTRFDLKDNNLGQQKYLESHIPKAVYVDLEKDLSGEITSTSGRHPLPSINKWKETIENLGIDNETQVVVYDDSLSTAARLWWMLRYVGHKKVAVLNGGFNIWLKEKHPVSHELHKNLRKTFSFRKALVEMVSMDYVKQNLENINLIDSRENQRYLGIHEPIDPVAGHIPGAKNFFFKNCLTKDGLFDSKENIRNNFNKSITLKETVLYCGSGVTACCNILAMEYAELSNSKLYVGSWSEWCKIPSNPMIKHQSE